MDPQSQPFPQSPQPGDPAQMPPSGAPAPGPAPNPAPFPATPQPAATQFPPAAAPTPAAPAPGLGGPAPAADPFAAAPNPTPTVSGLPPLDQTPQDSSTGTPAPSPMPGNVPGNPMAVPSMAGMNDTQSGGGGKRKLIGIGLILFAIIVLIGLLLLIFKK